MFACISQSVNTKISTALTFSHSDPVQSGSHRCSDALRKSEKVVKHVVTGLEVRDTAGRLEASALDWNRGSRPPQPGLGQRHTALGSEEASAPFMARQCCELKWTCSIQCSSLPEISRVERIKRIPTRRTRLVFSSQLFSGDSWRPRKAHCPTLFLFFHSTECSVTALAGDATS